MANVIIDDTYLYNIANAIRVKTGNWNATYTPDQMAMAIYGLFVGSQLDDMDQEDV